MNKFHVLCGYKAVKFFPTIFILGLLSSCVDYTDSLSDSVDSSSPIITVKASTGSNTRMAYASGDGKMVTWTPGDTFRWYNTHSAGTLFTLTDGAGTTTGSFSGRFLDGMDKAIYPASCTNTDGQVGFQNLHLPFSGQSQSGNASTDGLSAYTYMMADAVLTTETSLTFKYLAAQLKFELTVPKDIVGDITNLSLEITSGDCELISSLCPSDSNQNTYTNGQTVSLSNITLGDDHLLTAYMMLAPVQLEHQSFTIVVTTNHSTRNYYSITTSPVNLDFQPGHQYVVRYTLAEHQAPQFTADIPQDSRDKGLITCENTNLYTLDYTESQLPVSLNRYAVWTATTHNSWINLSETKGQGCHGPILSVSSNTSNKWREGYVTITNCYGSTQKIQIRQQPKIHTLPVVFHIVCDATSRTQNLNMNHCQALLDSINHRYQYMPQYTLQGHFINYCDANIRLCLAGQTPDGQTTNGVIIEDVANAYRNGREFLMSTDAADRAMVWPQDQYINIFIFEFSSDDTATGWSNYAYLRSNINEQYLGYFYTLSDDTPISAIPSLHSIAINARHMFDSKNRPIVSSDIVDTTIHELGHYFGLYHVFNDGRGPSGDDAVDDTPNYDRSMYIDYYKSFITSYSHYLGGDCSTFGDVTALELAKDQLSWRIPYGSASAYSIFSHSADAFCSTNIMDYYMRESVPVGFSTGQIARMRYAIAHSPTVPHDVTMTRGCISTFKGVDSSIVIGVTQ